MRRVWASRPTLACAFSTGRQKLVLTHEPSRFPRGRPSLPPTPTGSVLSLSGHVTASRWRALPKVHRHRAGSLHGSLSNRCYLFREPHGPIIDVSLSFPICIVGTVDMCDTHNIGGNHIAGENPSLYLLYIYLHWSPCCEYIKTGTRSTLSVLIQQKSMD